MPRERRILGSPADWLVRARADLALAKIPLPEGGLYEDLCFHAQQAAEESIKAVYRAYHLEFRYTHDLADLLDGLQRKGIQVPAELRETMKLSHFAWEARYPVLKEPVTKAEYEHAVALAERTLQWAEELVKGSRAT